MLLPVSLQVLIYRDFEILWIPSTGLAIFLKYCIFNEFTHLRFGSFIWPYFDPLFFCFAILKVAIKTRSCYLIPEFCILRCCFY